jgi:hypothetical protein
MIGSIIKRKRRLEARLMRAMSTRPLTPMTEADLQANPRLAPAALNLHDAPSQFTRYGASSFDYGSRGKVVVVDKSVDPGFRLLTFYAAKTGRQLSGIQIDLPAKKCT